MYAYHVSNNNCLLLIYIYIYIYIVDFATLVVVVVVDVDTTVALCVASEIVPCWSGQDLWPRLLLCVGQERLRLCSLK